MIADGQIVAALAMSNIVPDDRQHGAISVLTALLNLPVRRDWLGRAARGRGVYCYGPPGRGKSMIVDAVFSVFGGAKRRVHFHEFLREIHRRIVTEAAEDGRLRSASVRWLADVELLCFDEFHVHDVADAYLISGFLDVALDLGIRIVATSNYSPDELLSDPQFHDRIQPMIDMIERHFEVVHFDGETDYRLMRDAASFPRFFEPLNGTIDALLDVFLRYERTGALVRDEVIVAGRALAVRAVGTRLLWTDFDELCVMARSHLDYLDLSERWHGLIVDRLHVDRLRSEPVFERFVWLIDLLYDRRRMLFIRSDHPLIDALRGLDGARDWPRVLSRLTEMQSAAYADMPDVVSSELGNRPCPS